MPSASFFATASACFFCIRFGAFLGGGFGLFLGSDFGFHLLTALLDLLLVARFFVSLLLDDFSCLLGHGLGLLLPSSLHSSLVLYFNHPLSLFSCLFLGSELAQPLGSCFGLPLGRSFRLTLGNALGLSCCGHFLLESGLFVLLPQRNGGSFERSHLTCSSCRLGRALFLPHCRDPFCCSSFLTFVLSVCLSLCV